MINDKHETLIPPAPFSDLQHFCTTAEGFPKNRCLEFLQLVSNGFISGLSGASQLVHALESVQVLEPDIGWVYQWLGQQILGWVFATLKSHLEMVGDDMMTLVVSKRFKGHFTLNIHQIFMDFSWISHGFLLDFYGFLRISMDFSSTRTLLRAGGQNALLSHLHHCLHLAACKGWTTDWWTDGFNPRISGWWLKNHPEKYESQWEGLSHIWNGK